MRKAIAALAVSCLLVSAASAQQFWEKKTYDKWSKDECKRMLNDSPWVQRYGMSAPVFSAVSTTTSTGSASTIEITYTAQLRSALPMRQAVVQQAVLEAAKQVKDAERLQAMRARGEQFLNQPTSDIVIVHFIYGSNDINIDQALAHYWQQQSLELLKDSFTLITGDSQRIAPIRFEALPGGGREFAVTFPRIANGKPVVTPQDQLLTIEFFTPDLSIGGTAVSTGSRSRAIAPMSVQSQNTAKERIVLQYKVKNMMRGGELVF